MVSGAKSEKNRMNKLDFSIFLIRVRSNCMELIPFETAYGNCENLPSFPILEYSQNF